ncbi:MAG: hypothetical protein WD648_06490 [Planctomycetaceae bacterium]
MTGRRSFLAALALVLIEGIAYASPPVQLTFDGRVKRGAVFVPSGDEIVFAVRETSPSLVLKRLKIADGTVTRLHPQAGLPETNATFAADGKTYAYLELTGNDAVVVHISDVKHTRNDVLKFSQPIPWDPCITPDGKAVVVSLDGQIVRRDLGSNAEQALTKSAGSNNWPHVSPDGRAVVFCSSRHGDYELYTIGVDGGAERRLTESPGMDGHPSWSPDGRKIAFTSTRDGQYEIYVIDADGSNPRRVTHHPERDDFAAWHSDGQKLLIVSERDGRQDLYLVEVPQ